MLMVIHNRKQIMMQNNEEGAMIAEMKTFLKAEDGATAIEYALIASLISLVIIAALTLAGGSLTTTYNDVAASL